MFPATWGLIPKGLMNFGSGGVNSYGSVCGVPLGAQALLRQMGAGPGSAVTNNLFVWYEKTYLPTNACYIDYRSGTWAPTTTKFVGKAWGGTGCPIPTNNVPKSKSQSVLCHVSLTKWRAAADSYMAATGVDGTSDRCGKLCYDMGFYVANLLNQWKANPASVVGALSADASSAGCKQSTCHGGPVVSETCPTSAMGNMKCTPCHTQRVGDGHNL